MVCIYKILKPSLIFKVQSTKYKNYTAFQKTLQLTTKSGNEQKRKFYKTSPSSASFFILWPSRKKIALNTNTKKAKKTLFHSFRIFSKFFETFLNFLFRFETAHSGKERRRCKCCSICLYQLIAIILSPCVSYSG